MSDEGFLARWSRRKAGKEEKPAPAPVEPPMPDVSFDESSLPPIESLVPGSDISAFLSKDVPAALKAAALSRVWTLNPAIRDYVGPADYAWDWNAPGGVPGLFTPATGGIEDALRLADRMLGTAAPAPPAPTDTKEAPETVARPVAPVPITQQPSVADTEDAEPPRRHGAALPRFDQSET